MAPPGQPRTNPRAELRTASAHLRDRRVLVKCGLPSLVTGAEFTFAGPGGPGGFHCLVAACPDFVGLVDLEAQSRLSSAAYSLSHPSDVLNFQPPRTVAGWFSVCLFNASRARYADESGR